MNSATIKDELNKEINEEKDKFESKPQSYQWASKENVNRKESLSKILQLF